MAGRGLRARGAVNYSDKAPDVDSTPAWLRSSKSFSSPGADGSDKENQAAHPASKAKQAAARTSKTKDASRTERLGKGATTTFSSLHLPAGPTMRVADWLLFLCCYTFLAIHIS